jgi:hypothetical protein
LSVQIHNITGLEIEKLNKKRKEKDGADGEDEAEESDDLPSSYCTIILNHQKIYKTRTKPKAAKPFFNVETEKFIRDWRTTEVMISVRDARVHENDPLLGVIYLPLAKLFEKRSQVMDVWPLAGGIGYGRARVSLVFRSVELQAPERLLGWDYGTLEIKGPVKAVGSLPENLHSLRLKLSSSIDRGKMEARDGQWTPKHDKRSVFIAVRKRYATPLVVEFGKSTLGPDGSPAFAVFWLYDIQDDKEKMVTTKVWKGAKANLKHASNCCDYDGLEDSEKPLGEIQLNMTFWRGLSGYHQALSRAGKKQDLADVMEVLDVVNENKEDVEEGSHGESDSPDSEEGGDGGADEHEGSSETKAKLHKLGRDDTDDEEEPQGSKNTLKAIVHGHNDSTHGGRDPMSQLKDYTSHSKQLHRRHRGIMQWKGARTLDWMMTKAQHGKGKATGLFQHGNRDPGLETEV